MSFLRFSQNLLERVRKHLGRTARVVAFSHLFSGFLQVFSEGDWLPPRLTFLDGFENPYGTGSWVEVRLTVSRLGVFRTLRFLARRHCPAGAFRQKVVKSGSSGSRPFPHFKVQTKEWINFRKVRNKSVFHDFYTNFFLFSGIFTFLLTTFHVFDHFSERSQIIETVGSSAVSF